MHFLFKLLLIGNRVIASYADTLWASHAIFLLQQMFVGTTSQKSFFTTLQTCYSGAPAAEGRQAEPHTHIRKLKGTHELLFSCVSWLAVLLVGAYARRRRRRRRWWSRATWRPQLTRKPKRHVNPWFKASFGHPCCSQLTPVKTRNPLTSIT